MENENICRLCLNVFPVIQTSLNEEQISIIEKLTAIKISKDDELPKCSCAQCITDLYFVEDLRKRVVASDAKLRLMFSNNGNFNELLEKNTNEDVKGLTEIYLPVSVKTEMINEDSNSAENDNDQSIVRNLKEEENTKETDMNTKKNTRRIRAKQKVIKPKVSKKRKGKPLEYWCRECGESFKSRKLKLDHNCGYKKTCELCGVSINPEYIRKHMRTKHNRDGIENETDEERNNTDNELESEGDSASKKAINEIIYAITDKRPFKYHCTICNEDFTGQKLVSFHKNKHYKKSCKICGIAISYGNFSKHMQNHMAGQQVCDICGSLHKSISGLRTHMFHMHKEKDLYSCDECGESFRRSMRLLHHKRKVHTGFRPHVCDTCGKRFFTFKQMTRHNNSVHLKLRNFICEFCKKGFSSKYALKVHTRLHTNETPYVCEICSEGFRQQVSYKTHMRTKHEMDDVKAGESIKN